MRTRSLEVGRVLPSFLRQCCILIHFQTFTATSSSTSSSKHGHSSKKEAPLSEEVAAREEAYRQLENLDFKTAAKILFTTPPKRKNFGLDFHLVQLFFACMPSLAVYLVAQYARSEIRRMEAVIYEIPASIIMGFILLLEAEQKKKQVEEEDTAKDVELASSKEESNGELLEVKVRLDALEEAVKEIVDEKRRDIPRDPNSNQESRNEKVAPSDKVSNNSSETKGVGGSSSILPEDGKIQHTFSPMEGTSALEAKK